MKTETRYKAMSHNTLEERLDALCAIHYKLTQEYKHSFSYDEQLICIIEQEIGEVQHELNLREQ